MERQELNCTLNARREDGDTQGKYERRAVCKNSAWERVSPAPPPFYHPRLHVLIAETRRREEVQKQSHDHMVISSAHDKVPGTRGHFALPEQEGESGKMAVICFSESAEVLMHGLECIITRAAAEMLQRPRALTQLQHPPPPCSLCVAHSPRCFCAVFSHSLTHTSLFLDLSPRRFTILLFAFLTVHCFTSRSNFTSSLSLSVIVKPVCNPSDPT